MFKEVFICYETTTGLGYAKNLKEALGKMDRSAFVANEDIKKGEAGQKVIDETIKECEYFIAIITFPALGSEEVKREINLAQSFDRTIIPCKEKEVYASWLSKLPIISGLQRIEFKNEDELANRVISEILKRETVKVTFKVPVGADVYVDGCKI